MSFCSSSLLQGSSLACTKFSKKFSHSCLSSSKLPNLFLQAHDRPLVFIDQQTPAYLSSRKRRATISAEAGKQGWDLGRFIKTLYFFNGPPSPAKVWYLFVQFQTSMTSERKKKCVNHQLMSINHS